MNVGLCFLLSRDELLFWLEFKVVEQRSSTECVVQPVSEVREPKQRLRLAPGVWTQFNEGETVLAKLGSDDVFIRMHS